MPTIQDSICSGVKSACPGSNPDTPPLNMKKNPVGAEAWGREHDAKMPRGRHQMTGVSEHVDLGEAPSCPWHQTKVGTIDRS